MAVLGTSLPPADEWGLWGMIGERHIQRGAEIQASIHPRSRWFCLFYSKLTNPRKLCFGHRLDVQRGAEIQASIHPVLGGLAYFKFGGLAFSN